MSYHANQPGERGRQTEQFRNEPTGGLGRFGDRDILEGGTVRRLSAAQQGMLSLGIVAPISSKLTAATKLSTSTASRLRIPKLTAATGLSRTTTATRVPRLSLPSPDEVQWTKIQRQQQQQEAAKDPNPTDAEINIDTEEASVPPPPDMTSLPRSPRPSSGGSGGWAPKPPDPYRTPDIMPPTALPEPPAAASKSGGEGGLLKLALIGGGIAAATYYLTRKK